MTRNLTTGMVTEVTASELAPILLIKAEFDTGNVNLWTGTGTLVFGADTYLGGGKFLNISPIRENQEIQANGINISLTGELQSLISIALAEDYQDRKVTIYFGALNLTTGLLIADPYPLFGGRMDVMSISANAGLSTISVKAESNLTTLKRPRNRKYTSEDQKLEFATDTFFNDVPALQDAQVIWGKG